MIEHIHNKILIFITAVCALLVLTFVLWNGKDRKSHSLEKQTQVIMLYMVGSDLESERGLASADIREIQESGFDEDRLKIIICTGGAAYWWNDSISADECAVFEVHADRMDKVNILDTDNMADSATITMFMDYVYENYSADSYSLIMWNHGGGANVGYGGDENHYYDTLALYQLDESFANSGLIKEGKKLEWIGFDACLMGMLEVANICSPYADYLVASEGALTEAGWDYNFLKRICDGTDFSGETVGREIVETYSEYYTALETYKPEYTIACMELSQTGQTIEKLEAFIERAESDLKDGRYSILAKERERAKTFGITDTYVNYDIVDLYNLAGQFKELYPKEAAELMEAVDKMVVCVETNVADAHGIAIYFPYDNKEYVSDWLEEYSRIGFSDVYMEFIKDFSETLIGESLTNWNMSEVVPKKIGENTYSVSLTPEQTEHYADATLSIWESAEEWNEGCYIMWTESSDVALDEDGTLYAIAGGKRFVLLDDAGHSANCSAYELERSEAYATYGIVVYMSWVNEDVIDYSSKYESGWAMVYVRVDEENPDGVIAGIYEWNAVMDTQIPGRVSCEIKQGVEISPFAFVRQVAFDDNGKVVPFEEWEIKSSIFTGFRLEGNLSVSMVDIEEDADILHVFSISDTQGNVYTTNVIN